MKSIIHYIQEANNGTRVRRRITENGALLSDEVYSLHPHKECAIEKVRKLNDFFGKTTK